MRALFPTRAAACLWGAVVFMPVGLNYLGFFLLLLAMLLTGGMGERIARLRAHPMWWPLVALTLWQALVLLARPHYPETGQNAVHGLRISLTVALALALRRDELVWALRGFVAITAFNLLYIVIFYTLLLKFGIFPPMPDVLQPMIMLVGNKSINNALIFTIAAAATAAVGLALLVRRRPAAAAGAFAITALVLVIINTTLPSRTSLLALLVVLPLLCVHQWRQRWRALLVALALGGVLVGVAAWNAPPHVRQLVSLGVQELEAAQQGAVSEGSWVVRYHMYKQTAQMVAEKPLLGWGIGAWNSEWRKRGPALLADYNMPHNDYLWMGSQTGLPGALLLLALMLTGLWAAWRRTDLTGRVAFGAMLILLLATSVNSALRDAQIGLSLLWAALLFLRMAGESGCAWAEVLPQRWRGTLPTA
ncbi:O-antigen ligase family protein [Xenophilus arseniciresistens]|uniref:O-antigen ligase family protein n=1 Tax=Xenophilus arseniciresistens TaxID=1283306 RepID=A0AAE3NBJ6_9BURK|nr:O-antigen ligase family protein [Xenophilus arseniciresistens]MDA7418328.1 O-antigen ligase family protein [Xenophilus arseniciresistens]